MVKLGEVKNRLIKNLSKGNKQRVGIAMALLGDPTLLVLDEHLSGLDADSMRIMREVFLDVIKDGKRSIIVSSHLLGELQKVATHYGIIRHGKMLCEMTAEELDSSCRTYVALKSGDMNRTKMLLGTRFSRVEEDEAGYLRVYDLTAPEEIVSFLYENGIHAYKRCGKAKGLAFNMRITRRRHASFYDGFRDFSSWLYSYKRNSLCRRRCLVCIRTWRNKQNNY